MVYKLSLILLAVLVSASVNLNNKQIDNLLDTKTTFAKLGKVLNLGGELDKKHTEIKIIVVRDKVIGDKLLIEGTLMHIDPKYDGNDFNLETRGNPKYLSELEWRITQGDTVIFRIKDNDLNPNYLDESFQRFRLGQVHSIKKK